MRRTHACSPAHALAPAHVRALAHARAHVPRACGPGQALQYARAAGIVASLRWSLAKLVRGGRRAEAMAQLQREPNIGKFRAEQIWELATRGTCARCRRF